MYVADIKSVHQLSSHASKQDNSEYSGKKYGVNDALWSQIRTQYGAILFTVAPISLRCIRFGCKDVSL